MADYDPPTRVYGVDFSADEARAGEKIWIAEGVVEPVDAGNPPEADSVAADADSVAADADSGAADADSGAADADSGATGAADERLRVVDCRRATEYLDVDPDRDAAVPALARFLGTRGDDVAAGLDFPFGLPEPVVAADEWAGFLRWLPGWADDPSDLARQSEARATLEGDAAQLRRETEEPLGALSPYGVRLRAQTFYGIRDVLRPLVLSGTARVLPMQEPTGDGPRLLEVYPAGTLDRLDCHDTRYKSDDESARDRRTENVQALADAGLALDDEVRDRAVENAEGDALDAVVAAFAAYQHTRDQGDLRTGDDTVALEGYIYV
jgi:hypothetical protein